MLYTPESSLQVELIVLRPGHRACRCSEAFKRAAEFEKHWRWWAEITHLTGYLSSPAGKDPSRSKNSHWAAWRGLPWKSKLCSFLPTEQWLGECPRSAEPCTSGAGSCWLKAQGDETIRETAGTGGLCPDPAKLLRRSFSVTWVTAYSFYSLSQDLNPPHDILRFSQNKTSSDLQLCHFKGSEWAWEMLYFMGSSEHHRSREESVTEARWDWNY